MFLFVNCGLLLNNLRVYLLRSTIPIFRCCFVCPESIYSFFVLTILETSYSTIASVISSVLLNDISFILAFLVIKSFVNLHVCVNNHCVNLIIFKYSSVCT
jgi:hypothetical protein